MIEDISWVNDIAYQKKVNDNVCHIDENKIDDYTSSIKSIYCESSYDGLK